MGKRRTRLTTSWWIGQTSSLMFQSSTVSTRLVIIVWWGRVRIDTKFERAEMVTQPKKVDTGKLQHHRREFQVEIQNRFAALASIPPDDLDSRGDTTVKRIHEAAISIAGRYKSGKPDNLSTGTKQLREKRRQMNRNGTPTDTQHWIFRDLQGDSKKDEGRYPETRRETDHRSHREQQKSETSKTEAALGERPTNIYYGRRWDAHSW